MCTNPVSKTGLIASPKKAIRRINNQQPNDFLDLSKCATAKSVQFSLRPFSGLFNPYSKSCSILCNHPGPNEVKNVVKQAKESWINEGKAHYHRDDLCHRNQVDNDINEHIPEELFRHYAGSDSRPLTPTPTVASGRTRTSTGSHPNARRCFTPDPVNSSLKERKQLILDLRRSHSQETLFWNASSELSAGPGQGKDRATKENGQTPGQRNMRLCEQEARRRSAEKKAQQQKLAETEDKTEAIVCINDREDAEEEEDAPRRRGKRRKKSKSQQVTTFTVDQEPETQIATLGPDSPNPSNRPSLIPTESNMPRLSMIATENLISGQNGCLTSSFLTEDVLKSLRRGLNIEVVENAFEKCMNKALQEALRTIPPEQVNTDSEALKKFKETMNITEVDNEKWLHMPRKYTRCSARFTLPINTMELAKMTPFEYVSKNIWISDYRKQLYRYVFNKFLPDYGEDALPTSHTKPIKLDTNTTINMQTLRLDGKDRVLAFGDLHEALKMVLGFHGTDAKAMDIKRILHLNEKEHTDIQYRSWCGIVAFAERYLNDTSIAEDPCDEVETADFESLERKFSYVDVPLPMKTVLNLIKNN